MYPLWLTEGGWIQRFLIEQPESGMGYQLVELYLKDGRIIPEVKVYDYEIMEISHQYKDVAEEDISKIAFLHRGGKKEIREKPFSIQ